MTDPEKRPEGPVSEGAHSAASSKPELDELESAAVIDTVHYDEALKVLNNYRGDETWDPKEEKKLTRKIDRKLMIILCVTYGFQYYDKAIFSQAALFGLRDELELTVGDRFSMAAAIFYLGFVAGAYPTMALAQRYPIERVTSAIVVLWGICLICTPACFNFQSLYAQRFLLGVLESGVSPLFMIVVGSWYKKNEQAVRMGVWYCMTGYVSVVSPVINYGLGHIKGTLSPWTYMYFLTGAVTIIWGVLLLFILPPDPIRAKGFNERERYIAVARLRTNNSGVRNTHFKKEQLFELLLDAKFWLTFFIAFLSMIANGPLTTFSPIIINSFGFSTLNSILLMMPAGAVSGTVSLLWPYLGRKFKNMRAFMVAIGLSVTLLGSLLLLCLPLHATGGMLFGIYILPGLGAAYAVLMGLQIANIAGYTKRTIASSGLYIGYCLGNFVGPLVFREQDAPRYIPGFIVTVVAVAVSAMLAVVYRYLCVWENNKRDKTGTMEGFENAYQDDLTDKTNPQFRYTL